jgi:succinate-semialdehyde dehydrogenase/glutarate-semialdehyde dehydrogenase
MYIDGQWCDGSEGKAEDVINPATEAVLGKLPHASKADLDRALAAAERGFQTWKTMTALERSPIIRRIAELIRERAAAIGHVLSLEQGKTLPEAREEIEKGAEHFEWMAEEGKRAYGRIIPARSRGVRQVVMVEPVGPVAAFTPWNFPASSPIRKLSTALGAGCSIIIKASEETPASCMEVVRCCVDAGVPAGVINLVFGVPSEVSEHLIRSPIIRKVTFTGSVPVGKKLAALAAEEMKTCTMELGGHSPVLVFNDVDCSKVVNLVARGKFRNAGQVCVSPTRFFVHESIHQRFTREFAELADSIKVGNGQEAGSQMGPLANPRRLAAMENLTADVRKRGGRVVAGGERIGNRGYFWRPTVFADMPDDAEVMRSEPFGPVAAIVPFADFDDAIKRANSVQYGLAGYAFTRSAKTAAAVSEALQVGMLAINNLSVSPPEAPIGGVKDSGYGREGGAEGILQYMNVKYVSEGHID